MSPADGDFALQDMTPSTGFRCLVRAGGGLALIRTFLNYFLERDIDQVRERDSRRNAATVLSEPSSAEKSS